MANLYANLIIEGDRSINDVPNRLKEDVIKILTDLGYEELTKVD